MDQFQSSSKTHIKSDEKTEIDSIRLQEISSRQILKPSLVFMNTKSSIRIKHQNLSEKIAKSSISSGSRLSSFRKLNSKMRKASSTCLSEKAMSQSSVKKPLFEQNLVPSILGDSDSPDPPEESFEQEEIHEPNFNLVSLSVQNGLISFKGSRHIRLKMKSSSFEIKDLSGKRKQKPSELPFDLEKTGHFRCDDAEEPSLRARKNEVTESIYRRMTSIQSMQGFYKAIDHYFEKEFFAESDAKPNFEDYCLLREYQGAFMEDKKKSTPDPNFVN